MDKDFKWVYEQKERFVKQLSKAYREVTYAIENIEYYKIGAKEIVEIEYIQGPSDYINVALNSCQAIGKEIGCHLVGVPAIGYIKDEEERKMVQELIAKAKEERNHED